MNKGSLHENNLIDMDIEKTKTIKISNQYSDDFDYQEPDESDRLIKLEDHSQS